MDTSDSDEDSLSDGLFHNEKDNEKPTNVVEEQTSEDYFPAQRPPESVKHIQDLEVKYEIPPDLVNISKECGFPLPQGFESYVSEESVDLVRSVSSESSKSELVELEVSEETEETVHRIITPDEFGEICSDDKPKDPMQEIIQKLYEVEDTFDSGKEFDDERGGDEDWVEPNYNSENFFSQPVYYDRNAFRTNALQVIHSLGYDSHRKHNLCVIDENTIVYLSGNFVHILDVATGSFRYLRSSGGGGLGHCAKHPLEPIFAVGERGVQPLILIYEHPSLNLIRVLRGGADKSYNYLCFSPNGKWLLSQASKPDSSLTVWNWNMERIVLKQRNMNREIWKVEYNPYIFGGIIASGVEHITFWKLIETFTGLKLIPTPGKWNVRTSCDVNTFCALPEDMVIGSNSNNCLFVWEGDEITREIRRRKNHLLHDESIVYLEFKEKYDEIFSVGLEGKYKVWDYTRIANARTKGKETLELQPTFQRKIKDHMGVAKPMSFQRVNPNDPDSEMYYMQDRQGSIWLVELAVKENLELSKVIFYAHDGPIVDIAPSPAGYYVATIGREGRLHVYNSKNNKLVMKKHFSVLGTSLLWVPLEIDKTASVVIIGFIDGTIRVAVVSIRAREVNSEESEDNFINIIQAFKPHKGAITILSLDPHRQNEKIIISGSDDCKIFLYRLKKYKHEFLRLCPIGFVILSDPIYSVTWSQSKESFLATSLNGTVSEVTFPSDIPDPPTNSFEIQLSVRISRFKSVKSEVMRNMAIDRNNKRKERRKEHQEKKWAYKIETLEVRKRKLSELEKTVENVMKKKEMMREKFKKQNEMIKKAKEDAERDQNLIMKQLYEYRSSDESSEISEIRSMKKHVLSDESRDSFIDNNRASDAVLEDLQNEVNEKKKKKGINDENVVETILDKKVEEVIKEVGKKLHDIKKHKQEENENLDCDDNKESEYQKNGINEDNEELPSNKHLSELFPSADQIIVDGIMKILDEEVDFDDLEVISEDEEVPPRYHSSDPVPIYFADYINDDCIWVSPGGYDAGFIYEYELGVDEPYKCTPIVEFEDTEMTCFLAVNGGYIIVGQGDGCLKVININPDNFTDFSNYWLYAMHDNINGRVKKICITYDYRFLYSIGDDSNIFYCSVNLINTKYKEKRNLPQLMLPPFELKIDDYIAADELSLEESVKVAEKHWIKDNTEQNKTIVLEKLQNLANKFEIILTLNEGLPESQKLPVSYFVINEEYYNRSLTSFLDRKKNKTEELEYECEKAKLISNKIYNYFLNPIKTHKVYIYAHSFYCKVTSFFQEKLSYSFLMAEKEADNIMMDILKKGRIKLENSLAVEDEPTARKKYKRKELEIGPFIQGEDKMLKDMPRFQKSVYTKIIQRRKRRLLLQNLLRIFKDQNEEKRKEFFENMIYKAKPPKDVTFRLKCDPLHKTMQNITKERKFYQLVTTKRKIYNLMSHFNTLILKAREMKSQAGALSINCHLDLKNIASEFNKLIWPSLPQNIEIFEPLEFPENMYMHEPPAFPHEKKISYKFRNRLFHQLYEINKKFPIDMTIIECGATRRKHKKKYTPWEMEFIFERKQFLMSEYLKKKCLMDDLLEKFDDEVRKLAVMKVEYEVKIAYLKICFLKYFEELQVIRIFQLLEDDADEKCQVFIKQKHIHILRINIRKRRIKQCTFDIVRCFHRCQMITRRFLGEIRHHPPAIKRFILKYFHKSWARELKKDEEGSSGEDIQQDQKSSSSSDMDSGPPEPAVDEIDSDDIDRLVAEQQEEFIEVTKAAVEQECGKELLDYTLETREKRFTYERRIVDRKLELKAHQEQVKNIREKVLMIQTIIAMFKVKKSLIQEEKYKQLRKIRTVVVLDSSQMQHFQVSSNTFPPMTETILFPLYTLKNLEAKKRKLKNKILTVDLDEKETLKHVHRLQLDIKYLKSKLQNIKDKVTAEKISKFGCDVNLPRMEETILRRIIKDYKYDTFPFHMKFHIDIKQLEQELKRVERSSAEKIKQNTFEHLKYGALLEQKRQYKEIMRKIQTKKQVQYFSLEEICYDIEKLKNLLKIQEHIIEILRNSVKEVKVPEAPFLKEKLNIMKQNLVDEILYKTSYENVTDESGTDESGTDESEDLYGEGERKGRNSQKNIEKETELERPFESLDASKENLTSTKQHLKSYKRPDHKNEDESPLDFTSEEEMNDFYPPSENDWQEEENEGSYYGD